MHTAGSLHFYSKCSRFSFESPCVLFLNASAEVLLLGIKVYVGGLANVVGLLTLPDMYVFVLVCMCACILR